ncbi:MAG: hypothetical protein WAP03_25490 [Methylorubrum rhodinum]|uniref:hypothetical protein n=1 Tax=Methylorubrum rhodinum TaxID=29428 RepID=UPI003BAFCFF1
MSKVPTDTLPEGAVTPERLQRAGVSIALSLPGRQMQVIGNGDGAWGGVGASGVIRITQAPIDRLGARGRLDPDPERNKQLMEAGDKLRDHYYLSGLSGFSAANDLNGAGGGHPSSRTPITETMESNRRSLRLAEAAMHPGDWRVVRDVVCLEQDLGAVGQALGFGKDHAANAVALDRLRRGLGELAELWGYSPPPRPKASSSANDSSSAVSGAAA